MEVEICSETPVEAEPKQALEEHAVWERLRQSYGVESMFVRVKTLSRILGLPAATIYAAMRAGRFAIPHVVICSAPMVRTDDLVKWIAGGAADPAAAERSAGSAKRNDDLSGGDASSDDPTDRAVRRRVRQRLIAGALERMKAAKGVAADSVSGQ